MMTMRYSFVSILCFILALVAKGQSAIPNSTDEILMDMNSLHEASPSGVPSFYDWFGGPRINLGNDPGKFSYFIAWGHLYTNNDFHGSTVAIRIQIRNIKAYYLSKKDLKWHLIQSSRTVEGNNFIENYSQNAQNEANIRYEKDATLSVILEPGYNFHFWTKGGRSKIPIDDIKAIFTTVEARMIPDNDKVDLPAHECPIILGMSGDYWISPTASWAGVGVNNDDAAIGRLKCVATQWRSFSMTTISEQDFLLFPPPIN